MTTQTEAPARQLCARCGEPVGAIGDGFMLYLSPGGHMNDRQRRTLVHALCLSEDLRAGRVQRVSPFAYEVTGR